MSNETSCIGREDGEALSASSPRPSVTKITIRPISLGSRGQNYSVSLDGAVIIASSRNPTGDACRHLVASGRSGQLEVWDDARPHPRFVIPDIVKAAAITVSESERHGPRFTVYKALPQFTKGASNV
ncbi:hypothetical protein [Rhizobium lentis]|uniref:Uncharacterized protein n=1 Tax=Rhizobium lentis TaxID=1138194 RepID=A0A7W8XIH9_9HYPH|nr:hypothetical protein [Rhizobium lentis]MBB4576614.1 hypothetical protein [Rhizobium lentis]MBB5553019.1 hypothetical protein [Rhizobium lentis]MBB5563462.1 hypothetical protein [Rhizobium lentis]MBB5570000.1 hypothetical protein [Rhizobium lentis]